MTADEVRQILREKTNGSVHGWARANGIAPGYVADVLYGRKTPGEKILNVLGIRKTITSNYDFI